MQNNLAVRTSDREHTAPRVVELDFGAQIFIWSLRHAFHFGEMAVRPGLFQVLGKQHIDEGVAMFLNLGEILQSDSERLNDIPQPWSSDISEDEIDVLRAATLAQHHVDITLTLRQSESLRHYDARALSLVIYRLARLFNTAGKPLGLPGNLRSKTPTDEAQGKLPAVLKLEQLTTEETILLVGIRVWVCAVKYQQATTPPLADYLLSLNLGSLVQPICAMMRNTAHNATRLLDVHCPRCNNISIDEGRFLHAVACLQNGQRFQAEQLIGTWLESPHRHRLAMDTEELAQRMSRLDHTLPLRDWQFPESHGGVSSWELVEAAAKRTLH